MSEPETVLETQCSPESNGQAHEPVEPSLVVPAGVVIEACRSHDARQDKAIAELVGLERDCCQHEEAVEAAKDVLKTKKALYDAACIRLRLQVRALNEQQPLFDQPQPQGVSVSPQVDFAWRDTPIHEALQGLTSTIYDRLEEADLRTMGQYADYCAAHTSESGKHPLCNLPGIGEGKAAKIQDAETAFWEREKVQKAAAADDLDAPDR